MDGPFGCHSLFYLANLPKFSYYYCSNRRFHFATGSGNSSFCQRRHSYSFNMSLRFRIRRTLQVIYQLPGRRNTRFWRGQLLSNIFDSHIIKLTKNHSSKFLLLLLKLVMITVQHIILNLALVTVLSLKCKSCIFT